MTLRLAFAPHELDKDQLECYRQVYVGLSLPQDLRQVVIGVTSAISGEGRTTAAVGLAQTLAADLDVAVTLAEVDFERPNLAACFSLTPAPGMSEILRDATEMEAVARLVSPNLSVVTAGTVGSDSARLLRQLAIHDPFHQVDGPPGVVILDLPPIINSSYASLAASVADALILVVRAGVTPLAVVREAITRLGDRPIKGVIFNGPRTSLPRWWAGR